MNQIIWKIIAIAALILSITLAVFFFTHSPRTAYLINQEVFHQFKGKLELEKELNQLEIDHQQVLDSIAITINQLIKEGKSAEAQKARQQYAQTEAKYTKEQEQKSALYTEQVWTQINQYIKDYAKEKDYQYLYGANGSGTLMYANEQENVTQEIIQYINQKYEGD